MAKAKAVILVVDDDRSHRIMLSTWLEEWGYAYEEAQSGEEAIELCERRPFDLVLMDVRMKGIDGIAATSAIHERNPAIPIIIMTAYSAIENAVEAIKLGAYDYLTKPLDLERLSLAIRHAVEHTGLVKENTQLRKEAAQIQMTNEIVGQSEVMGELINTAMMIAPSEATVLITGESGTGKELFARLIHNASKRAEGPYIAVNCAAITDTLLESELFGHERGAFTGADKRREGRFQAANRGTLFLDEIGELPRGMQAKLLRAIQEKEIQRVGDDRPIKVDTRIIAATNRDLALEVLNGQFREDLYYRLNVATLTVPPLRERASDIPLLCAHFLKKLCIKNDRRVKGFTPGAMDKLARYSWPGNVRELENTIERAIVILVGDYISERELPANIVRAQQGFNFDLPDMTLAEMEQSIVENTLKATGGNKSEAARKLGITRKTLLAKLQKEKG